MMTASGPPASSMNLPRTSGPNDPPPTTRTVPWEGPTLVVWAAIAAAAVIALARRRGVHLRAAGVALTARKGLPLSGGQGGSAASAVAGAVAANALLGGVLDADALLVCCLDAEARIAGRHLDNIAPVLLGGIVLVRSLDPIEVVRLPVPTNLHFVLAQPAQRLSTAKSRRALPGGRQGRKVRPAQSDWRLHRGFSYGSGQQDEGRVVDRARPRVAAR